jgi:hypothetical protein
MARTTLSYNAYKYTNATGRELKRTGIENALKPIGTKPTLTIGLSDLVTCSPRPVLGPSVSATEGRELFLPVLASHQTYSFNLYIEDIDRTPLKANEYKNHLRLGGLPKIV